MAHKVSKAAQAREASRALEDSQERRVNWERLAWTVWMERKETKGCLVLQERRGTQEEGGTKDPKETEEKEEMLGSEVTRVTQDGTASSEEPKERRVTSAPWASQAETVHQEGQEIPGRMVALAEGDLQELRATRAALASRASRESRAPEGPRVHLVPWVLLAWLGNKAFLDLGEVAVLSGLLENEAEPVLWGERVSPENQGPREVLGTAAPVDKRETMGETGSAVKDAEAKREKEGSLGTQDRRVPPGSLGQMAHQDPKVSEAEGEIQELQG